AYSGFSQRSPLAATQRRFSGFDDQTTSTFMGQGELKYRLDDFIQGLSTRVRFDYLRRNVHGERFVKPYDVWEYDPNPDTNSADTFPYIFQGTQNARSSVVDSRREFTRMVSTFGLDYQRSFGNHNWTGLFLMESNKTENNNSAVRGFDLISLEVPFLISADPSTLELVPNTTGVLNNGANESALLSYIGRLNYNYDYRLFLEATLRVDQSSLFAQGERTGYFPSFSAGWVLSRESFLEKYSQLDLLKIRASYSQVGSNIGIDPFQYLSTFEIQNGVYLIDDGTGIISTTGLANSDVTWFENNTYNLGLEGRFWGGLLGFEADVFYRLTKGRFTRPTEGYPTTFGDTSILPLLNLNDSDDRGVELLVTHSHKISDDFAYHLNANITYTESKWVRFQEDLPSDPEEVAIVQREGKRRNRFFGFESDGLFQNQEEIDNHAVQDENDNLSLRPGDIKYVDQNGDGVIDFKDNVELGRGSSPDMSYGIDLGFTYKNFTVSGLFQGAALFNTYITAAAAAPFSNESIPYDYHKKYSWTPDPDDPNINTNPNAQLPYITGTGLNQNSLKVSDFWLKENDYLRLKTLNLNYSFPKKTLERIGGVNSIDIYASGTNLFTWDKLGIYGDTFDPETRSGTVSGATSSRVNSQNGRSYPIVKTLTLGIKVSL
ncbi:MAG: SusC/RagA family TonB-linked outer membrane protein, partial [Flavobacteriaceae bacterium]